MQFVNSYNKQIRRISIKQLVLFQKITENFVGVAQKNRTSADFSLRLILLFLDINLFHSDVIQRAVVVVGLALRDFINRFNPLDNLPESRILPVKMRSVLVHYEKLA